MRQGRLLAALLAALLACSAGMAQAHRFHAGMTEVGFNQNSGNIEVVHSYMTHDLDALLETRQRRDIDLSTPEDEALLRQYVEQRFALLGAGGQRLPLRWVGITVEVERVTIYQEVEATPLARAARVRNEVLVDFKPDQRNTLNLKRPGALATYVLDREQPEQDLR